MSDLLYQIIVWYEGQKMKIEKSEEVHVCDMKKEKQISEFVFIDCAAEEQKDEVMKLALSDVDMKAKDLAEKVYKDFEKKHEG